MKRWALLAVLVPAALAGQSSDQERFRAAAEYSRQHQGDAVLVVRGDRVVFEEYQNGYDPARPHMLASGTKTFSCALAAAAIQDGLVSGWDEPAARTLTEWAGDPRRSRITVRQLLDLSSGLAPSQDGLQGSGVANKNLAALGVPLLSDPGERFRYGPSHYYAFGELVRRRLRGEGVLEYLDRRVLAPIGLEPGRWVRDAAGNPNLPGGAFLKAREWAKFGQLLRDEGRWNGRQVVRADLLRECTRPSPANPAYGLALWRNPTPGFARALAADRPLRGRAGTPSPWSRLPRDGRYADVYFAAGAGQQRMYVIPREGLVVVRFGRPSRGWDDVEFLDRLLKRSA